ncbi:MAG: TIM44-like domain-containing protein [Gammaproteobacteria bacterium]|nr:TIM44-like domain-containing protein [Gammaproteobacteria bacterium]
MRSIITLILVTITALALVWTDAEAKRFGGGRSFGMQRSTSNFSRAQPSAMGQSATNPLRRFLGPMMGLAAGAMLASLFMGNGLGTAFLSWIVVAAVVFLIIGLVRRLRNPNASQPLQHLNLNNQNTQTTQQREAQQEHWFGQRQGVSSLPSNFDSEAFIREAKAIFIRLQAAYDQKNTNDLRQFTAPQVFAEIQLQLQERGNEPNYTEVISLEAHVLDVNTEQQMTIHGNTTLITASVQFTGKIREAENAMPENLNETWNLQKESNDANWLVAGIQQN